MAIIFDEVLGTVESGPAQEPATTGQSASGAMSTPPEDRGSELARTLRLRERRVLRLSAE